MEDKILDIIEDLIQQLYEAKGFNTCSYNAFERNIFEAEMQEKYLMIENELEDVVSAQQYQNDMFLWEERNVKLQEELERAEEALSDALIKNEDLVTTLDKVCDAKEAYFRRLQEISKVVNDTWS